MISAQRGACRRRERGAAAVELAILTPLLIVVLVPLIFYARFMWHYTAAQKAAQDAALYMSRVSAAEIRSQKLAPQVANIAVKIAQDELAELFPGGEPPLVQVFCGSLNCVGGLNGRPLPTTVRVVVSMNMYDVILGGFFGLFGLPLTVDITMPYVGS